MIFDTTNLFETNEHFLQKLESSFEGLLQLKFTTRKTKLDI